MEEIKKVIEKVLKMNNFNFLNNIFKFLQKKPSPLLFSISLVTAILIFTSDSLLEKIFILEFRNKYSLYIGITFLVSTALILIYLFLWLYKKIQSFLFSYIKKRNNIKTLLNLNEEQYEMVIKLYYKKEKSANLNVTRSNVILLEKSSIIRRASIMSTGGLCFSFYLQQWVIDYINKHKDFIKKIEINGTIPNDDSIPF